MYPFHWRKRKGFGHIQRNRPENPILAYMLSCFSYFDNTKLLFKREPKETLCKPMNWIAWGGFRGAVASVWRFKSRQVTSVISQNESPKRVRIRGKVPTWFVNIRHTWAIKPRSTSCNYALCISHITGDSGGEFVLLLSGSWRCGPTIPATCCSLYIMDPTFGYYISYSLTIKIYIHI